MYLKNVRDFSILIYLFIYCTAEDKKKIYIYIFLCVVLSEKGMHE